MVGRPGPIGIIAPERTHLRDRARLLSEVIGAFAAATSDYEQLLDVISQTLAEVLGDLCSVLLASEDGQALHVAAAYDRDPGVLALTRDAFAMQPLAIVPVQQRVMESGEAYLVARISADRAHALTTEQPAAFPERIAMHSVLLVALRARGRAIGVLNLVRHRPEQPPYDEHDRDLAQLLADHAAVAIANARLLRRRDRELVVAKEAAERATRELEAFSYSVAHDLRSPLRVIDRFMTALQGEYAARLDDDGRRYLGRVRSASQRMADLIDDLLTLSRVSHAALNRGHVDLTDMARRIIGELRARSPEREIDPRITAGLVSTADARLLRVALENLLENAWKFTARQPHAIVEVGGEPGGDEAVFFVRDNGAGFDMRHADKLFQPFQRLHSDAQFEGTGVGLAIVHRVIGRHGGRVWAESQPDRGTTFYFTLGGQT